MLSALVLVVLAFGLTGLCGGCGGGNGGPAEVRVALTEDSVEASPLSASKGRVTFLVENKTGGERQFAVLATSNGQLRSWPDEAAVEKVSIPGRVSEEVVVDLDAGSYVLASWPTGEEQVVADWDQKTGLHIRGSVTVEVR